MTLQEESSSALAQNKSILVKMISCKFFVGELFFFKKRKRISLDSKEREKKKLTLQGQGQEIIEKDNLESQFPFLN